MLRATFITLLAVSAIGCTKKDTPLPDFTGDVRMVAPFVTDQPITNGKLYMSKGRLRVELGTMVDLFSVRRQKGWRMFPEEKQYIPITGQKQVSTYLPSMTNGSPCPSAERPSECKMVGKEEIEGRSSTKWELVNHNGVHVFLWTDDKLQIAVRWRIENVTYELMRIHEQEVADDLFNLPPGYTEMPTKGTFLEKMQ
jgi:hypothetical protein